MEVLVIGLLRVQCFWYISGLYAFSSLTNLIFYMVIKCILQQQGVKAVISKSFERIHRSNLVGMGIIPLCFKTGEDAETLGLTGEELYTIELPNNVSEIKPGQDVTVITNNGKSFTSTLRFDTEVKKLRKLVLILVAFKQTDVK